jgi:hypothetical protein
MVVWEHVIGAEVQRRCELRGKWYQTFKLDVLRRLHRLCSDRYGSFVAELVATLVAIDGWLNHLAPKLHKPRLDFVLRQTDQDRYANVYRRPMHCDSEVDILVTGRIVFDNKWDYVGLWVQAYGIDPKRVGNLPSPALGP